MNETATMLSEHERDQHCHRYYQPWLTAQGSSQDVTEALEHLSQIDPNTEAWKPIKARDSTLIAIAQNVVLRLNLRRCMVSLIDTKHQYVIAEATRSTSREHKSGKAGDEIWLGNAILSRPDAMCEHCLGSRCQGKEEDGSIYECEGYIVNDCRQNELFAHRPYVMQEDGIRVRFYAGVPLIAPDGYRVGVLAVTDENPHDHLKAEELRWMQEMAACAMDHLEWALDRVDRFKGDRIVRGMADFVDKTSQLIHEPEPRKMHQSNHGEDTAHGVEKEEDNLSAMYTTAAESLRRCTLADRCVVYGAKLDTLSSSRLCKVLAGSPPNSSDKISIDLLQKLGKQYPHGHVFSPGSAGSEEALECITDAETVVFLPLIDHLEGQLIAGVVVTSAVAGRIAIGSTISHLHAFTMCMEREVFRINMQKDEAAKTTFMASISHELRSPLHGILGAAEFLMDSAKTSYESGLITSVTLCGKQLLDTLNHVLDYSKINSLRALRKKDDITEAVDLSALVEEASEAITIGNTFKTVSESKLKHPSSDQGNAADNNLQSGPEDKRESVSVLLDIRPRQNWMVRASPGAIQRVVMNLLGNALKFTASGFVALSLRATGKPDDEGKLDVLIRVVDSGQGMSKAFQQAGMFRPFSQENALAPGTGLGLSIVKQIVNDLNGSILVKSNKGSGSEIDVRCKLPTVPKKSSETANLLQQNTFTLHADLDMVYEKTTGKRLVLLDPLDPDKKRSPLHPASRFQQNLRETCEQWFGMEVSRATSMSEQEEVDIYLYGEPPPIEMLKMHKHVKNSVPVILACQNDRDAIAVIKNQQTFLSELGQIVEVMQQPCGPRKLAAVLLQCLKRAETKRTTDQADDQEMSDRKEARQDDCHKDPQPGIPAELLSKSVSAAVALPLGSPVLDLETPGLEQLGLHDRALDVLQPPQLDVKKRGKVHGLIVDDNKINRQLLITFFKKEGHTYQEAENGQEAVDAYERENDGFDIVLMDISMPVMDGLEATRVIRAKEQEKSSKRTRIIALTGLGSAKAREDAEAAGVDLFMAKPVRFAELKKLLQP